MKWRHDLLRSRAVALSDCERYRYYLRIALPGLGALGPIVFCMLNPSVADETVTDPTIRRCMAWGTRWGHSDLIVVNLYGLRSSVPDVLLNEADPVGPDNDAVLREHLPADAPVIAAWGAHPAAAARVAAVVGILRPPLRCLGVTATGAPVHPLARGRHRVPESVVPRAWAA